MGCTINLFNEITGHVDTSNARVKSEYVAVVQLLDNSW